MALDNNMSLEEPGKLLQEYQSGETTLSEDEKPRVGRAGTSSVQAQPQAMPSYRDILRSNPLTNTRSNDYTDEAKAAGFGLSRYDNDFYSGEDIEQSRAVAQSDFSKIGTGLVKGGITAATTAVNTTLGTVFGLGASMFELASDSNGNGRGLMDTIDAGVNNWLSNQMVKIQNWAEDALPNYRTAEERSEEYQREWWKHMGTVNFIGDSILKNFGFTVGAMVGGMAWSKLIGAALSSQLANNIMKGAVAAAEGDSEAAALMRSAAEAVRRGTATEAQQALARAGEAVARGTAVGIDADALVANIENAARAINRYGAKLQLYGAAVGAMGEGTVEGIMAKNEFLDQYNRNLDQQFNRDYGNIEQDIISSGKKDWVQSVAYELPNGELAWDRQLTDEGKNELYRRRQKMIADYQSAKDYAEEQGNRLSSTTFLLNLPILTASNTIQFGRMLSGGWNTTRNAAKGLIGGIKETAKGVLEGNYRAAGSVATRTALGALKVAGSESFEEMAQGTVSSGAKEVAAKNLASFINAGYDDRAIGSVRDWFSDMYAGGREYLSDPKNWQEGAIGALTGLFGIPGRRWQGGVIGEYRDAKERLNADRASAETLNRVVNSKEFQDKWRGYIRHLKYDSDMENAVKRDDPYAWHTADDNQLISDVIMFADAGRLEDLNQIVSYYGNMSSEEAAGLKEAMKNDTDSANDWVRNSSPAEIVEKVKKQANRIQTTINQYKRFYDAMSSRAPVGASKQLLNEMVFTAQQIKAYENRFLQMFGETMEAIEPYIEIQSTFDKDGKLIEKQEDREKRFDAVKKSYERIFSMTGLPIRIPKAMRDETDNVLDILEGFAEGDDDTVNKIRDMRKLANSRNVFYQKLIMLQEPSGQEEHQKQAMTQEKMDQKSEQKMDDIETKDLTDYAKVREDYHSKNADERISFFKLLEKQADKNPAIKDFVDAKRTVDGFASFMVTNPDAHVPDGVLELFVSEILRNASSLDEIKNLPDSLFPSFEEYAKKARNPFTAPKREGYERIKKEFRDGMNKYLNRDTSTQTRNTLQSKPIVPDQSKDEKPTGQDAAQPASAVQAPVSPENHPAPEPQVAPAAPVEAPQTTGSEPESTVEEFSFTKMAPAPTTTEAAEEAMKAEVQPEVPGEEDSVDDKIPWLHQSAPEVSTGQATKARESVSGRKEADLSDFLDYLQNTPEEDLSPEDKELRDDPEFARIWNALKSVHSFEYIATQLKVGDEIEFVILPESQFPYWRDRHQVLMCTADANGNRQILTPLASSNKNGTYLNLRELREAIEDEYSEYLKGDTTDPFVFSKKSKVWAKRAGQIDYKFSDKEEFSNDQRIDRLPGYDPNAPMVFVNRMGNPVVVRGNKNLLDNASNELASFFSEQKPGSVYYLVDNGDDSYIPVRLFVEHFNHDTMTKVDNPMIAAVKSAILSIVEQTTKVTKDSDYNAENEKLWKKKEALLKLLCLDDIYFELGNYTHVGPALKIVSWKDDPDTGERVKDVDFRRANQITDDWLINRIADGNYSFQVQTDEYGDALENLEDYINSGIFTSNAQMLRAKGVDFYAHPWDTDSQDFKAMTASQVRAITENRSQSAEQAPVAQPDASDDSAPSVTAATLNPDISWADPDADMGSTRKNNPVPEIPEDEKPVEVPESEFKTWDELGDIASGLEMSGWKKDNWVDGNGNEIQGWDNFVQDVKDGKVNRDAYDAAVECAGALIS